VQLCGVELFSPHVCVCVCVCVWCLQVTELAAEGKYDLLVIESTGQAEGGRGGWAMGKAAGRPRGHGTEGARQGPLVVRRSNYIMYMYTTKRRAGEQLLDSYQHNSSMQATETFTLPT
jgi:hypothetical protein